MATPVSGVNSWLTLNGRPLSFDPGSDNLATGAVEYGDNQLSITSRAPDHLEIRVDGERLETERYGRWIWRPAGFAGLYDIEVSGPEKHVYHTQVRVIPSHFSQQHHEWMLKEIGQFSADLLFQLNSPATEMVTETSLEQLQSPLRAYYLIESLMSELDGALAHIKRMPHRALVSHNERRQWHEVTQYASHVAPEPGMSVALPLQPDQPPRIWPQEWRVENQSLTYNVYENRLLKHFLWRQMLPRLYELENRARQEIERRQQNLAIQRFKNWEDTESERIAELEVVSTNCKDMQRRVIGWGSLPFLQQVSLTAMRNVPTQVLQKHPAYGRFYQVYLRFQRELKRGLNSEGFLTRIAVRKLSELYEMWSVFKLTRVLLVFLKKAGYQIISNQGFFRVDDEMFHFEVNRDAEIALVKGNKRVVIRYEPHYPSMNTLPYGLVTARQYHRAPDLAVELWQEGEAHHVLIFDAKYKTRDKGGQKTFIEEDLQKMSAYYGEIAWKARHSTRRPTNVVSSAYILYPGEKLEHNKEYPEVGALPLVPGPKQLESVYHALTDLLNNAELL